MIYEKSCGAVIYHIENGTRLYLVEHMVKGHFSICKGHMEGNETEFQTAQREILEETALSPEIDMNFRETIRYSPYDGCTKDVIFFVAESPVTSAVPQKEEVSEIFWLPLEQALSLLTFDSDKNIVKKADNYISSCKII